MVETLSVLRVENVQEIRDLLLTSQNRQAEVTIRINAVTRECARYVFVPNSTDPDDGINILQPTIQSGCHPGKGRWVKCLEQDPVIWEVSAGVIHPTVLSRDVSIGSAVSLGKLSVHGDDVSQVTTVIRGADGQTADIFDVENFAGSKLLSVEDDGNVVVAQRFTVGTVTGVAISQGDAAFGAGNNTFFWDESTGILLSTGAVEIDGPLAWTTDNFHDIGATLATRPRTIYAGTSLIVGPEEAVTPGFNTIAEFHGPGTVSIAVRNTAQNIEGIFGCTTTFARIGTNTTHDLYFNTDATTRWRILSAGELIPFLPNTYDLGISTFEVRSIYVGTSILFGTGQDVTLSTDGSGELTLGSGEALAVPGWLNVGTAAEAVTVGDSSSGLAGAARIFYNQSAATQTFYNSSGTATHIINAGGETVFNEPGADINYRIEADDEDHVFAVDAGLNNLVFCHGGGSMPGFNAMDGGVFLANVNVEPTGDPIGGIYVWSVAGAGNARGGGGTVTEWAPSGTHCEACGCDFWTVASFNLNWKSWCYICGVCGAEYKGGPQDVIDQLSTQDKGQTIRQAFTWEDIKRLKKVSA